MNYSNLTIAVITHEIDSFQGSAYLLHHMCDVWMQQGANIVVIKGPNQSLPEADVAFLHTDVTAVGADYGAIIEHYPRVINGRVTDISKTVFSDELVDRFSSYDGQVIVKTNANFGGQRERELKFRAGDYNSEIDIQRPWRKVEWLDEYPIFKSLRDVPTGVWRNDKLVVEKYHTEQNENGEYVLRVWVFFGDKEVYYACISNEPLIKSHNTLRREFLDPGDIPESLRRKRAELGFELGKFDFSMSDEGVALYDVNRTPGSARNVEDQDQVAALIRMLSTGLESLIA